MLFIFSAWRAGCSQGPYRSLYLGTTLCGSTVHPFVLVSFHGHGGVRLPVYEHVCAINPVAKISDSRHRNLRKFLIDLQKRCWTLIRTLCCRTCANIYAYCIYTIDMTFLFSKNFYINIVFCIIIGKKLTERYFCLIFWLFNIVYV